MEELPAEWTILDLRRWVAEKAPSARVPYGSWSSTLYKMTQQRELRVVRGGGRGPALKVYARGDRRIGPTGEEIRELEAAWREFRAQIETPDGEFMSAIKRGEEA